MPGKKPRSDAKLMSLPPHQRDQLVRWLVDDNLAYEVAVDRVWNDFGVRTSTGAISNFYATQCYALGCSEAKHFADEVVAKLEGGAEQLDTAMLALVRQRAFQLAKARNGDVKDLAILASILGDTARLKLKQQEVDLSARKVALLEQKAAQADAAENVTRDTALTPVQREAKMREIFGLR